MNTSTTTDDKLLAEHLKLIHKIAWEIHQIYGCDPEDLFSEGCLQYLLKKEKFDSKLKTKLTSFIWIMVWRSLKNYILLQQKMTFVESTEDVVFTSDDVVSTNYKKHQVTEKFALNAY